MPTARLKLGLDGGGEIGRAMGAIVSEGRKANAAMSADARQASRDQARIDIERFRTSEQTLRQKMLSHARAEREATRLAREMARDRSKVDTEAALQSTRTEGLASRLHIQGAYREAAEVNKAKRKELTEAQMVEREKTRLVDVEARRRAVTIARSQRAMETGAVWRMTPQREAELAAVGGGGNAAMGGGRGDGSMNYRSRFAQVTLNVGRMVHEIASQLHGQIQGAQERRGELEHQTNTYLGQSGGSNAEQNAMQGQINTFVRSPHEALGATSEDVAGALGQAQGRFSLLSNGTGAGDRAERMRGLLQATRFGRVVGAGSSEMGGMYGWLRTNMGHEQAMTQIHQLAGQAQLGNVELGDVIGQALPSMMQAVTTAQARAGTSDPAQLQAIAQATITEQMANLQVQAGAGLGPGLAGGNIHRLERQLSRDTTARQMRHRLMERNAQQFGGRGNEAQLAAANRQVNGMFRLDSSGNVAGLSAENQHAPAFFGNLLQLFNGDPTALQNFMGARGNWSRAAGGHNQLITGPAADTVTAFFQRDTSGKTGLQRAQELQNATITPEQEAALAARRQNEIQTRNNAQAETRDQALTDNTSAMVRLSNAIASISASHPIAAMIASAGGSAIGGSLLQRWGTFAVGQGAVAGAAPGVAGAAAAGGAGLSTLGKAGLVGLALGVGAGLGEIVNRTIGVGGDLDSGMNGRHGSAHGMTEGESVWNEGSQNLLAGTDLTDMRRAFRNSLAEVFSMGGDPESEGQGHLTKEHGGAKGAMTQAQYLDATRRAFEAARINVHISAADLIHAATVGSTTATNSPGPSTGPRHHHR